MGWHMKIRKLHGEDAAIYQDIRLEALQKHPEAFGSSYEEEARFSIEFVANRLTNKGNFTLGAFEKNQLIGVATLTLEQKNKLKHRGNIVAVYVKAHYRSMGIAKGLMKEAIREANQLKGVEQIYLAVVSANERAKKLYESLGFKAYGVDKNALKLNDVYYDEVLMVLFL